MVSNYARREITNFKYEYQLGTKGPSDFGSRGPPKKAKMKLSVAGKLNI